MELLIGIVVYLLVGYVIYPPFLFLMNVFIINLTIEGNDITRSAKAETKDDLLSDGHSIFKFIVPLTLFGILFLAFVLIPLGYLSIFYKHKLSQKVKGYCKNVFSFLYNPYQFIFKNKKND